MPALPIGLVTTCPAGEITYHLPCTPCPFAVPAAVSDVYVWSGQPAYVTTVPPDGFLAVPIKFGCTAEVAVGFRLETSNRGGHAEAHPPVHATFPPFSGMNTYRVRPFPLVSTDPMLENLCVASFVAPPSAAAVDEAGERADDVVLPDDELLLPHAAASRATGTTNRGKDRKRAFLTPILRCPEAGEVLTRTGGWFEPRGQPCDAIPSLAMSLQDPRARRVQRERDRRLRVRRQRAAAGGLVAAVVVIAVVVAAASAGGSGSSGTSGHRHSAAAAGANANRSTAAGSAASKAKGTGVPGHATVPILMYHVINPPPSSAPYPGLYVPAGEFAAQMQALKAAGWHAVTMDQLEANWTRGAPLGPGKPIVLSFDNGYASQYTNALPVLRQLGWVGVENIQLTGLPTSQGGLSEAQVRGLLAAGWELDTQGISHADLIALGPAELRYQVATARQLLRSRYAVPVNWFCYPSGHYNATVIAAVRAAGFVGSTTVVPGWATRADDPYRLPRLRVLGGTSPSALLAQIAAAQGAAAPPSSYPAA